MKVNYVTVQQVNGKLWATAHSEDSHQDFSSIFGAVKSLYVLHFFESLKKAADTARNWNMCYEQNGTLMSWDEIGRYTMAGLI